MLFALGTLALSCSKSEVPDAAVATPDAAMDASVHDASIASDSGADARAPARDAALDGAAERPLRLIAPLSTSRVTGTSPVVRWEGAEEADHVEVQVCEDRACTDTPVMRTCPTAGGCALGPFTSAGPRFWCARAVYDDRTSEWTPTWEMIVLATPAPRSTNVGLIVDVDGDARAEIMYASHWVFLPEQLWVRYGANLDVPVAVGLDETSGVIDASAAGDLDGDGFGDLVIGDRGTDRDSPPDYREYWMWYPGSSSGIREESAHLIAAPGGGGAAAGGNTTSFSVTAEGAGDIDGDGYGDVVVGATNFPEPPGGCLFVYPGSPDGPVGPTQMFCSEASDPDDADDEHFGRDVVSGADVDGDGFADVYVVSGVNEIRVRELRGGPGGLGPPRDVVIPGYSLASYGAAFIGDVNADGYADLGVPGATGDRVTGDGALFVFLGGPSGIASTPDLTARAAIYGTSYVPVAGAVSPAGDLDADGFDDVVMGNIDARNGLPPDGVSTGMFAIFAGNSGGIEASPRTVIYGPDGPAGLFGQVSGPGDIDGDGRADLVVSASRAFTGSDTERGDYGGRVYFYPGPVAEGAVAAMTWAGPDNAHYGTWLARGR